MVEKQAILHLKALIVGILNPEDWGRGFVIGLPHTLFVKNVLWQAPDVATPLSFRTFVHCQRFKMRY